MKNKLSDIKDFFKSNNEFDHITFVCDGRTYEFGFSETQAFVIGVLWDAYEMADYGDWWVSSNTIKKRLDELTQKNLLNSFDLPKFLRKYKLAKGWLKKQPNQFDIDEIKEFKELEDLEKKIKTFKQLKKFNVDSFQSVSDLFRKKDNWDKLILSKADGRGYYKLNLPDPDSVTI